MCLSSLNIIIEPDTFVGIVGPVAAGKSSLLKAILGELNLIDGELEVNTSSLSYSTQIPWIIADTLRANIILGKTFDKERYSSVIHACCLDIDIDAFGPNGDLIMIGDRGINLSGGQKARISLARALYTDADIYLLDDPLAAVDRKVARLIYDQCIGPNGLLSKKTRLLITHQIEFLAESHQTILLKNGRIVAQGRVTDLPLENRDIYQTNDDQLIMDDVSPSMLEIEQINMNSEKILSEEDLGSNTVSWSTWRSFFIASLRDYFELALIGLRLGQHLLIFIDRI
ncbi:unnamed protein product [Rotaria sp. Silwood1]|nr:unnamed protein product [Rotaria sp. Silwood1]CAF1620976.1 unnamed protein product [Rotaria sp. Silwood1]CAF3755028.1 unnamed protein product [Rotaria sp. Silwood1]CAF3816298.1 unnamed protein product [Rotaria sp. Silwood1]CAF4893462.1 unnamed protein product [Rotaria sp. Silwood1]